MSYNWYSLNNNSENNNDQPQNEGNYFDRSDRWIEANPEKYEQDYQPEEEAPRITDTYYSPSWILEEKQNRLNPDYVSPLSDEDIDPETFNTIAIAVENRQANNWKKDADGKPIDPGWDQYDPIWKDYIKPLEDGYIAQQQTAAVQAEVVQAPETERAGADAALPGVMDQQQPATATSTFRTTPQQAPKSGEDIFYDVMKGHPEFEFRSGTAADYNNLKESEKIIALLTPSAAGTDIANMPENAKFTQGLISSAFSAGGVGDAGELVLGLLGLNPGVWMKLGVTGAAFGYNYTKYLGLHEGNETVDKIIEATDWGDPVGQKAIGRIALNVYKNTGNEINDPNKFFQNMAYIYKHPKEIFNALRGKGNEEYNSAVIDAVMKMSSNVGADFAGNLMSRGILNALSAVVDKEDKNVLEMGQTTRANQGLSGVYTPEYYGAKALEKLAEIGQELYDRGMTDPKDLEYWLGVAVTGEYGDVGNVSEFTEHEMFDVANTVENQQARAIEGVAHITGDKNQETAAHFVKGNFVADVLDNVPVVPDVVRLVGQNLTKNPDFFRTSGGYNEVFAQWNIENLNSPVGELTARDRRFSGITEDGKISNSIFSPNRKLVTPNDDPNEVKNPFKKARIAVENFFSPTNEYKAIYEGDAIFEYVTAGIEDALRVTKDMSPEETVNRMNQFIDELSNPEKIPTNSPLSTMSSTVLFNSVKDDVALAVRARRAEIAKAIQKYNAQANNRAALNALAKAFDMKPAKILDLYQNKKTLLTQMIINKADENGGKIPGFDIDAESREFGEEVIRRIGVFAGDNSEAWNVQQLTTQLSSSIADGVIEVIINKYNIKPEGFVYRFGDMIKKMQNLVLLGLSPSYLANNFTNNIATRTALGYGGYMMGWMIDDWMDRFGFSSERLMESFTDVFTEKEGKGTKHDKLSASIRKERQRVEGTGFKKDLAKAMEKVGDAGSWASNTFGVFGKLSGEVERKESKQIVGRAMMTYMARTWKPGINFRKMPVQLEAALGPTMAKAVYDAISAGINMEEVKDAIYGSYIAPSVQETLLEAAQNLGLKDADNIITEYFVGSGMLAELNKALQDKRGDEIGRIIDEFSQHLKNILAVQLAEDLRAKAETVAKNTKNIKFSEALEWANNISDGMMEVWLNSQEANSNLFTRRLREGMSPREFHELYQAQQKNLNEQWQGVYHQSEQIWSGILKGLGFKSKTTRDYLAALHQKNQMWAKFYEETQPKLFQPYLDALVWRPEDTADTFDENGTRIPGTWSSRAEKAWNTYITSMQKTMETIYKNEAKYQGQMDKAFISGLEKSVGKERQAQVQAVIVPMIEQINEQRQKIIDKVREIRAIADNTSILAEKDDKWKAATEERRKLTTDYYTMQQKMYNAVAEIGADSVAIAEEAEKTPEEVKADVVADIAEDEADEFKKVAERYSEMMVDAVLNGEGTFEDKYLKLLQDEATAIQNNLEAIDKEIQKLTEENEQDKNLEEIKKLNNQKIGLNIRAQQLVDEIAAAKEDAGEVLVPSGWSEALTRKNAYNIAKKMGAPEDLAVAYSKLYKARANEFERNHPGMKFRDADGTTVNYLDREQTVPIQGADGQLYQVETIYRREADINTDEFREFYGSAPEMFKDGKPIVVYHGSPVDFNEFDKSKISWNGWGGFWFSESRKYAGGYAKSTGELNIDAQRSIPFVIEDEYNRLVSEAYEYTNEEYEKLTTKQRDIFKKGKRDYSLSKYVDKAYADAIVKNALGKELTQDEFYRLLALDKTIDYIKENESEYVGYLLPCYLSIHNPLVADYDLINSFNGEKDAIANYAKENGYDGIIYTANDDVGLAEIAHSFGNPYNDGTTAYFVFEPNQIKSIYNFGAFDRSDNNIYFQKENDHGMEQRIKGQFTVQDGEKIATLFRGSDMSTLVHETMGHPWTLTLNDGQIEALAAYNGWTANRYRQLENQWYYDPDSMSEADRTAWVDSQEKFAYGFEQYLLEGIAPNSKMKEIFESFKRYLMEIYKAVKHLIYKGEPIDIHAEQHGVTLAEIFDSMFVDSDREFNIDRTGLQDVENNSITYDGSYGYAIPESIRQYLVNDSVKLGEKVNAMKASAEEAMRYETQVFLNENKKWGLTEEEQIELVTEIMHELGLNQDLTENLDLMDSIQEKMSHFPGGEKAVRRFIDEHRNVASKISDEAMTAMLRSNEERNAEIYKYVLYQADTPEQATSAISEGKAVAIDQVDYATLQQGEDRKKVADALAKRLWNIEQKDKRFDKEGARARYSLDDYVAYIYDSKDEKGNPVLSESDRAIIYAYLKTKDKRRGPDKKAIDKEVTDVRTGIKYDHEMPAKGTFVVQTYAFEYGRHEIVGAVIHNGKPVAYIPKGMEKADVEIRNGKKATIIGVSMENPEQAVYLYNNQVKTVRVRPEMKSSPYKGEMDRLSMPVLDPVAEAHHQMVYEDIEPILKEFKRLFPQKVNDALMGQNYSSLSADTKELLRQYIDVDVRQDMMNTKYKAAKAGEMMRDAALLNYNKRYGFDNVLSLLCPYQFWNTRSFMNWMRRIGTKGGKFWRRYARLKELEERNQKEFLPSRVSGMIGLYVPGLADWMGDAFFVSPNQFLVVPEFIDPFLDFQKGKNAVTATAKRLLQEKVDKKEISYEQYMTAINPETQKDDPVWQEAYAEAQLEQGGGNEFEDLTRKYLGLSLPLSIAEAVYEGDPSKWSQWPMTRLGTAFRSVVGNNFVGKGVQAVLSAPEKALRKAVGDEMFAYNEFGSFGEYYIRQQVFDMLIEGRIEPQDALQASIEKDGNKIWEEAADRQREEILVKMQGGAVINAMKKMAKDLTSGEADDSFKDDFFYLLTSIASSMTSKQIVRDAEQTWRDRNIELSATYENNDKEARDAFYKENPDHRYNSLRWESDPEQALRKYCYQTIMSRWFELDDADKRQIEMSFDSDFKNYVLDSETRAIETMNLNKLVGYAQALNGNVPYLATDKLSTANAEKYNIIQIPQTEKDSYNIYREERDRLYPGMVDVNSFYYKLPAEERATFKKMYPGLDDYQQWDYKYKKAHPEVKIFNSRVSDYYDMLEAEKVCASLDSLTMKALTQAALSGKELDTDYQPMVYNAMRQVGSTKKYKDFEKNLINYILGK